MAKLRTCERCGTKLPRYTPRFRDPETNELLCEGCHHGREGRPMYHGVKEAKGPQDNTGDTPMICTHCGKSMQSNEGTCSVTGGPHQVISQADKEVQGMGNGAGPGSSSNNEPTHAKDADPKKASVAHPRDAIRTAALTFVAHDSGDGETVYHCPFCGSGEVIGRSDGTIECDFCNTHFTVQVQPEFSAMPQTINGQPNDMPGMPDGVSSTMPPEGLQSPQEPPQPGEDNQVPPGAEEGAPADEEAQGKSGSSDQPPWLKGSSRAYYLTTDGGVLDEERFLRHIALKYGEEPEVILAEIRALNR